MSKNFYRILAFGAAGQGSRLSRDFLAGQLEGLDGFVPGGSAKKSFWESAIGAARAGERTDRGGRWTDVLDDITHLSRATGTDDRVLAKLDRARSGDVLFILTGQQPGLLGGPLLTVYKAWTAVAVSARLERLLGLEAVPLFWAAGDDSDFEEIKTATLLTEHLAPFETGLTAGDYRVGSPVGDIPSGAQAGAWDGLKRFLDRLPGYEPVQQWLPAALAGTADHGRAFVNIIARLTRGSLAFIDGRSGAVRRCARGLMADYHQREDAVKQAVRGRGLWLVEKGYHSQLTTGQDSGIFLLEEGVRRTVPPAQADRLARAIQTDVERCSPGAILRTLIQDELFRPAAVVLGPSEIAYRAQMNDLFDMFNIPRPPVIPRLSATFFPPVLWDLVGSEPAGRLQSLVSDPAGFTGGLFESAAPAKLRRAWECFQADLNSAVDALDKAGREALSSKLQGKLSGRLNDLQKRLAQLAKIPREAGREAALEAHPFLVNLGEAVKPRGAPQDRALSVLVPMLFSGAAAIDSFETVAGVYVDELMDGNACHVVYSS